ncbi:MAG TPA: lysophospholipid acyltransferase family protein [Candidatus Binataceae bacterium]|nr:lysophospholipid acyltransferase family protein [Candidatus Binataceae bacterium]
MAAVIHLLSLFPDFVLYALGVLGGLLAYRLDSRHAAIGLRNLEIAYPELPAASHRRILRDSYLNLGRSGAEYIRLGGFFYRRLLRKVRYEGIEVWDEARRRYPGRGILILTAHFGNFELLPAAHAMHGYQISLVHHTQRFLPGDALMTFVRERAGVEIIRKHAAARAVLRALRDGEMIGIPFDQNAKRSEALFVPFFGELAATSSGLARLARMSGAAVVPVFIVRDPNRRTHRIVIEPELSLQHTADAEADILENTRQFVDAIERRVRSHPDQFLWTHRRYRTRPRGAPKIYE